MVVLNLKLDRVSAMSASDILKRNTDSVKCTMENDVFASLPDLSMLAELDLGWSHEKEMWLFALRAGKAFPVKRIKVSQN